jgi:hypothetical protein
MNTLVFKLVATPLLIQPASLAGRRWGPAIGGWLVGLPLTSGPIAFFLAIAAPLLGARLAGMFATFPVFTTVLTVFAHRVQGEPAAQRVLRGLLLGLFGYSGFFLVSALALQRIAIVVSFAIACVVAGAIQFITLSIIRGSLATGRRRIGCD